MELNVPTWFTFMKQNMLNVYITLSLMSPVVALLRKIFELQMTKILKH